jgi:hypothetical protein
MGKQSIGDFIAKNNIVRFERTNMSDKKPTDDGYENQSRKNLAINN